MSIIYENPLRVVAENRRILDRIIIHDVIQPLLTAGEWLAQWKSIHLDR